MLHPKAYQQGVGILVFLYSPNRPGRLWVLPSPVFNGQRSSSPRVKWPGRYINHSAPPSLEVKNEWSYTSTPPVCLHGADSDDFTFFKFKCIVMVYN